MMFTTKKMYYYILAKELNCYKLVKREYFIGKGGIAVKETSYQPFLSVLYRV